MPIYEYVCDVCGERAEIKRPMEGRDAYLMCKNNHAMHRVWGVGGVVIR